MVVCAISAHAVQSGAPRQTPRCIYTDTIKVGPEDQAPFSPGHFGSQRAPIPFADSPFLVRRVNKPLKLELKGDWVRTP